MSVLSLPDAKQHLNITVDQYNDELEAFIAAAEAVLAKRCGPLEATPVTRRIAGGCYELSLPVGPPISLTSVTPYSGSALTLGDLYLDTTTGLVSYNNGGPFVSSYYTVVYSAGRTTCPGDLLLAVKELVRHMWETRRGANSPRGSTATVPGAAFALPNRVSELIAPHVQVGVG